VTERVRAKRTSDRGSGAIAGFLLLAQPLTPPELGAIALVTVASIGASVTARPVLEAPGELGG
jgi:threonine/homoserine efflux transporter RhtA